VGRMKIVFADILRNGRGKQNSGVESLRTSKDAKHTRRREGE
jgi:hypothetical protein